MKGSTDSEFACRQCGEEVHPNARACRHCGARRESNHPAVPAWHQPEHLDGVDMPAFDDGNDDESFDYDDFVAREFGTTNRKVKDDPFHDWKKVMWWVAAVITFLAFTLMVARFW